MNRHFFFLLSCLFSLSLQHCSAPKSQTDNPSRGGEPTDDGKLEQQAPGDGGGGTNVGNGGSGIVCRTGNTINRIELFDFYEAKVLRGWEPSLAFTPDQSRTIFEQAIDTAQYMVDTRWKSTDPVMATYLTERLKSLPSEVIFVDQPMPLQDDVAAVINAPTGCRREQIVIASEPHLAQKRYTVRKEYFEHPNFSNLDRAGLILHELLYRLTSSNGATTSRGVRYINAVLFADQQSETLTPLKHYFEVMKEAEFPWGGAHGVPVYLSAEYRFRKVNGDNGSNLSTGFVVPGVRTETVFGPQNISCHTRFEIDGTVSLTSIRRSSAVKIEIPGLGEITGHGSLTEVEEGQWVGTPVGLDLSRAWEVPYEGFAKACAKSEEIEGIFNNADGIKRVQFPEIDQFVPVNFYTPLYSVKAEVKYLMIFEWRGDEPAKFGGDGHGSLTFASGDKCNMESAFASLTRAGGGRLSRCAARVVPGGSWLKFEGIFGTSDGNSDKFHTFSLDKYSDTEYNHKAVREKVALTLKVGTQVDFDDHGRLRKAFLGKEAVICSTTGGKRLFLGNSVVRFDERGCASNGVDRL